MGIAMQLYTQQSLGSLVENLSAGNYDQKEIIEHVQNIFAITTKCLDQIGRSGAFHHIVRRTAAMSDTALYELDDSAEFSNLPLTGEGVFGKGLEDLLKSRKEKKKQLDELMPEVKKRKLDNSQSTNKRFDYKPRQNTRTSSYDPKYGYSQESGQNNRWNNFRIPKRQERDGKGSYTQHRQSQPYKGRSGRADKPAKR